MREDAIQQCLDRQAIADVLIEYCCALDTMQLERLAPLFTDDCEVDYGPDDRLRSSGAAALATSLERLWRWSRTSHHLSNIQVRFETGDAAQVVSYVYAWHERNDGSSAVILGQYQDRFVRVGGGWRISRRRMLMNGCDRNFTVNIHRLERRPPPPGWTAPDLDRVVDAAKS